TTKERYDWFYKCNATVLDAWYSRRRLDAAVGRGCLYGSILAVVSFSVSDHTCDSYLFIHEVPTSAADVEAVLHRRNLREHSCRNRHLSACPHSCATSILVHTSRHADRDSKSFTHTHERATNSSATRMMQ